VVEEGPAAHLGFGADVLDGDVVVSAVGDEGDRRILDAASGAAALEFAQAALRVHVVFHKVQTYTRCKFARNAGSCGIGRRGASTWDAPHSGDAAGAAVSPSRTPSHRPTG